MSGLVGWLGGAYSGVLAAHVIFIIFWMAGLFMLPRYLAYQAETDAGSAEDAIWSDRSQRLRRIILTPSLLLAWILGLALMFNHGMAGAYWLHTKLLLVLLLSGYHMWMAAIASRMGRGLRPFSTKALRILNEVPGVAAIFIVILVVMKPF